MAAVVPGGGTLHRAAARLLSLAAPELVHDSNPSAPVDTEPVALLAGFAVAEDAALPKPSVFSQSPMRFKAYVTLYVIYALLCWWYELRVLRQAERRAETAAEPSKPAPQPEGVAAGAASATPAQGAPKERFMEWDLIKAVMLYFVIILHVGRNGWERGGLSDGEQTFFLMLAPFPMPVFAFVSGVFGASVERTSLMKTLCYTLGTFVLAKGLAAAITLLTPGPKDTRGLGSLMVFWNYSNLVFWYLKALFVWRFTVSPIFYLARKRQVPVLVPFVAIFVLCYFLRHLGLPIPTHVVIYFIPFYAQGLLCSPARWSELLADRRCTFAAIAFLGLWCSSLIFFPSVREWNDVACAKGFLQCPNSHWPGSMNFERRPVDVRSFLDDVRIYATQDALSMAVAWLVAACARPLRTLLPRLAAVLLGCGSRTLYGYVLHFIFFLHFGARMGLTFPPMPDWLWAACSLPVAFQALLVFCSSLTERIFSPVIMPFWLLGLGSQAKA